VLRPIRRITASACSTVSDSLELDLGCLRQFVKFLAANNWTCQADRSYDQVWLPPADEGDFVRPVLVPRMPTFVDYRKRLAEATESIARLYGWQISQLTEQIAAIHADLFFVRVSQVSRDGTIPLRQATSLLESIDQMIRSAALTAWKPKSSGRGRVPGIVSDFIRDDLRMGTPRRGASSSPWPPASTLMTHGAPTSQMQRPRTSRTTTWRSGQPPLLLTLTPATETARTTRSLPRT
jgi:hypothetical protein